MYKIIYYPGAYNNGNNEIYTRYAPWEPVGDILFSDFWNCINKYTMLPKINLWYLWCLVGQVSKLKEGAILEVGTWRGGSSAAIVLCSILHYIEEEIYLCDTFKGLVKSGDKDPYMKDGQYSDANVSDIRYILSNIQVTHPASGTVSTLLERTDAYLKILEGIFPDDTACKIKSDKFRFCHIDVDVYAGAKDVFDWVWDKTVINGIVHFDCYGYNSPRGVTEYVETLRERDDLLLICPHGGGATLIKIR